MRAKCTVFQNIETEPPIGQRILHYDYILCGIKELQGLPSLVSAHYHWYPHVNRLACLHITPHSAHFAAELFRRSSKALTAFESKTTGALCSVLSPEGKHPLATIQHSGNMNPNLTVSMVSLREYRVWVLNNTLLFFNVCRLTVQLCVGLREQCSISAITTVLLNKTFFGVQLY